MTSKLKGGLKIIWTTLKWLVIAIGCFLILILVVNLDIFDEKLNPEFVQLVESYKSLGTGIPDKQNGFYYLLAFNGPPDQNLHDLGRKMVRDYELALQQMNQSVLRSWNDKYDIESTRLQGDTDRICDFSEPGCLTKVTENPEAVRSLLKINQQLLSRYRRLHDYDYFVEKMIPSDYAPIPASPIALHKLFLTGAALSAVERDIPAAIDSLHKDTVFWRKALANATEGLIKIVASTLVRQNFMLLAEIIHHAEVVNNLPLEQINKMIRPLSAEELNMEPVLSAHVVRAYYLPDFKVGNCMSPAECVMGFFYQRNATMNFIYGAYKKYSEVLTLSPSELAGLTPEEEQGYIFNERQPIWPYNITGKLLIEPLMFSFMQYTFRIYNLEGYRRLVALQIALKEAGVSPDGVSQFIRNSGEDFNNLYTNLPMDYDENNNILIFKGMNRIGKVKNFSLML